LVKVMVCAEALALMTTEPKLSEAGENASGFVAVPVPVPLSGTRAWIVATPVATVSRPAWLPEVTGAKAIWSTQDAFGARVAPQVLDCT
jgi:hypothetical protein